MKKIDSVLDSGVQTMRDGGLIDSNEAAETIQHQVSKWGAWCSQCGIPERHRDFRPAQSKSERWSKIYTSLKDKIDGGPILALLGGRGAGKTQLGVCLAGWTGFSARGPLKRVSYKKAFDIFLDIRSSMRGDGQTERDAIRNYLKPYLLIIDAFEVRGDTDFENRMMDHIVDCRYDAKKATIIISNETAERFQSRVGLSICDRIAETGGIVVMDWQSFRGRAE